MRDQCAINAQSKMRDQCAIVIFFLNKSQIDEREYTNLLVSCRGLALRDPKKRAKASKRHAKSVQKGYWFLGCWFLGCLLWGLLGYWPLGCCFLAAGFLVCLPSLGSSWLLVSYLKASWLPSLLSFSVYIGSWLLLWGLWLNNFHFLLHFYF